MPTIFSHPAIPLALGLGLGKKAVPRPVLITGALLSMAPDLDVLAFRFGIPYSSGLGHRGLSHSLLAAALLAALVAGFVRFRRIPPVQAFAFLFVSIASHGILDALTDGGMGIAFLWPFSEQRFFAPIQVIQVSPLSLHRFLSVQGLTVLKSELLWVWLPAAAMAMMLYFARRKRR